MSVYTKDYIETQHVPKIIHIYYVQTVTHKNNISDVNIVIDFDTFTTVYDHIYK